MKSIHALNKASFSIKMSKSSKKKTRVVFIPVSKRYSIIENSTTYVHSALNLKHFKQTSHIHMFDNNRSSLGALLKTMILFAKELFAPHKSLVEVASMPKKCNFCPELTVWLLAINPALSRVLLQRFFRPHRYLLQVNLYFLLVFVTEFWLNKSKKQNKQTCLLYNKLVYQINLIEYFIGYVCMLHCFISNL